MYYNLQFLKIIALVLMLGFYGIARAQSFKFTEAAPDTFEVDASEFDLTVFFYITNTSTDTLEMSAERIVNQMSPGHSNFFCWDLCYDSTVDVSDFPILLPPGDTTRFRYLTFVPAGINGQSSVTMRFYTADTSQGVLTRDYHYKVTGGINASSEAEIAPEKIRLYPNPASQHITLDLDLEGSYPDLNLEVLDLQGKVVYQRILNNSFSKYHIPIHKLPEGIYSVRLESNGQRLALRKLLIQD